MDISSLLEVEVKEGKASELRSNGEIAAYQNIPDFSIRATDARLSSPKHGKHQLAISHDERHFYKLMFGTDIASVRFRKLHCTACDIHIGSAPADAHNMHEHPILHVLLCTSCRNFYGDGTFEQGDDATDMFCRWCANGGNLYCCSYCSNTFCYNCIKRNFDPLVRKKIERDEKWKCFVCNPADLYSARAVCWALLEHVQTVTRILQSDRKMNAKEIAAKMKLDESQCCPHKNKRKRADSVSDDEEEDETYGMTKRKRRRVVNNAARRSKRRIIKLETPDNPEIHAAAEEPNPSGANQVSNETPPDANNAETRNDESPGQPAEDAPQASRPPKRRLRSDASNRTPDTEEATTKFVANDDDIPPPLLQFDQTMVEGNESLSFGESRGPQRILPKITPSVCISPVPTANLLKKPATIIGTLSRGGRDHRIIRGVGGTPLFVRKLAQVPMSVQQAASGAKNSTAGQSAPMVTIPSRNHMQPPPPPPPPPPPSATPRISVIQPPLQSAPVRTLSGPIARPLRTRVVSTKPGSVTVAAVSRTETKQPPSVIDLDSDSDEPVVLVQPSRERRDEANEANDRVPGLSTETFPVRPDDGFLTILAPTPRSNDEPADETATEDERSRQSPKTTHQEARLPAKSIDAVLGALKTKLKKVMESAMLFPPDRELVAARAKTRAVNRTIKRTVAELTSLNENLVRAYRNYKRECTGDTAVHTPLVILDKRQKSGKVTPLDMECWRESEPEGDDLSEDEEENLQNVAPVREIRPFRRRVHRACEARPETANKSVQAYDVRRMDYEHSIGYTLLLKADYDAKRQRDTLKPVMVPDENFGKYEQVFISYLQHIEDHGMETEEAKELLPPIGISVNELIEADIPMTTRTNSKADAVSSGTRTDADDNPEYVETNIDENIEILEEEHLEIETTKSSSSDDSDSSSSSGESATGTSEAGSPDKMKTTKTMETQTLRENKEEEEEEEAVEESQKCDNDPEVENNTPGDSAAKPEKNSARDSEEETVLAVRALIEEDSSNSNSNSNTDVVNSWKPREDDDCTILD